MEAVAKETTVARALLTREVGIPDWLAWVKKGSFAVLDQGLFAGSNFLINVVLARWLSPADYGAFAVAFSAFLLLATVHTAILVEPMMVFAADKYAKHFRAYLGLLLVGHVGLSAIVSFILAIGAFLFWHFGSSVLSHAVLGLAIAAPAILLLWLFRRVFYVRMQPHWSALGGALYLFLTMAGVYSLCRVHRISSFTALVVMGAASALVSVWFAFLLHPRWQSAGEDFTLSAVVSDHWSYGKWATAATVLQWMPTNFYYAVLPVWGGLEGCAALRAIMNVLMPILHTETAISILLLPAFVKTLKTAGSLGLNRFVRRALLLFVFSSVGYWGLLSIFHTHILIWLYGPQYQGHGTLLILAGMLPLWAGVDAVLSTAVRATERPDQVCRAHALSSFVAVTLGLWFVARANTVGAVLELLASSAASVTVLAWWYAHHHHVVKEGAQ